MNKKQELALAIRAFSFYVEVEDKKAAHDMLKRIEVSGSGGPGQGQSRDVRHFPVRVFGMRG